MQERDVDLLLVDSGDLHDGEDVPRYGFCRLTWMVAGTGLSDGFPPGGIDAHDVRFPM